MERLLGHRERPIPALRNTRRDVPEGSGQLFCRMLAKAPERRPQSMTELIAELEACRTARTGRASVSRRTSRVARTTSGNGRSIYTMVDPPNAAATPPSELRANVFVARPGLSGANGLREGPGFSAAAGGDGYSATWQF